MLLYLMLLELTQTEEKLNNSNYRKMRSQQPLLPQVNMEDTMDTIRCLKITASKWQLFTRTNNNSSIIAITIKWAPITANTIRILILSTTINTITLQPLIIKVKFKLIREMHKLMILMATKLLITHK